MSSHESSSQLPVSASRVPAVVEATVVDSVIPATHFVRQGYSIIAACSWMIGSIAILALASVLTIGEGRSVYLPGLNVPVPETCTARARFGINCPGCGLTRSFIHFADGRWIDGMRLNPAGIVIFLFVAAQIPAALVRFFVGRRHAFAIAWSRSNEIALIVLPVLTCIQWSIRLMIGDYS